VEIHPLSSGRWDDLLALFGSNGAYANCWCTWWILGGKSFGETKAGDRRALLEKLTVEGKEPGLIAYFDAAPVGWCAVGPRERYAKMMSERAKIFRPDDAVGNWVINCFFVPKEQRRNGIAMSLLDAAVDFAFDRGAASIDGYPMGDSSRGAPSLFVGTASMFERAGFVEISRVRQRPRMRRVRADALRQAR
jgi:GNAT superfamily N-acetyltransferase